MKTSLKANLLKHLITKKEEGGFTLIELLVVIIIIGILAAIALPSFLNQANKARQSEAKTYIGSMNRGQQAYRLENPVFAPDFNNLAIGIPTSTTYYTYTIPNTGSFGATSVATAKDAGLKGYIGGVQLNAGSATAEATTIAIICEATAAGTTAPTSAAITSFSATATAASLDCANNWKKM
ncbi:type IV pilin-like G/H family protein [Nodosilinea sp. LEGE 06152]|uniref:type IV pilin-like G/H family protein n=1 Tax=Nodosilinea sp. LEGE 06152 TaxID=2777966 RepID=UPI001880DDA0|nr:type IV pilin-like G/H family protein [Nodosilinea sp. LEGE 06152]MBE9156366.1 type IV pilin-like G/H family protein [Nodosilinea sp. LEGE 06152]